MAVILNTKGLRKNFGAIAFLPNESTRHGQEVGVFISWAIGYTQGMAGAAGLEPVTSAVTGQRSNQLSYAPAFGMQKAE